MRSPTNELFAPTFVQPPQHPAGYEPAPPCSAAFAFPDFTPALPVAMPVDASADEEWLRKEKNRLETYLTKHLGLLRQQREELAQMRSDAEADLLTRELELNRQLKLATRRDQELTLRETALDTFAERANAAEEELRRLHQLQEQAQRELDTQREILEQLFLEVDQVRDQARVAKKDYTALRKAAGKAHAQQLEWRSRLQEFERRELTLQQEEAALQRRTQENHELEEQLRSELESREQELVAENRELEQRRQELALESLEKDYLRRKLGSLSQELDSQRTFLDSSAKKVVKNGLR